MNSDDLARMQPRRDWQSPRARNLDFLWKVYHAKQYDEALRYSFIQEEVNGQYIPLRERRPSVRYRLPRIVVKKTVSMCFGGRNWPHISSENQDLAKWLEKFYRRHQFSSFCTKVATMGSIGTVVPMFSFDAKRRILSMEVWNARDCVPEFDRSGILRSIQLKYLSTAGNLRALGLGPWIDPLLPDDVRMWYRRYLDATMDSLSTPTIESDWDDRDPAVAKKIRPIDEFTTLTNYDNIPACWVRNLPTEEYDDSGIDGTSTFSCVIDIVTEIDYVLSQVGRGLRYNADPTLLLKEPLSDTGLPAVRSATHAVRVGEKGDAKLLEMTGQGQKVALECLRELRNFGLEVLRGSRKDPQKSLSNAASGKLAEILDEELISLGSELRTSYGSFLLEFTTKIVEAMIKDGATEYEAVLKSVKPDDLTSLQLLWGPWFEPTSADHVQFTQALKDGLANNLIDYENARRMYYGNYGMPLPRDVDWNLNLQHNAEVQRAQNQWRLEMASIAGVSAPITESTATTSGEAGSSTRTQRTEPTDPLDIRQSGDGSVSDGMDRDETENVDVTIQAEEVRREFGILGTGDVNENNGNGIDTPDEIDGGLDGGVSVH